MDPKILTKENFSKELENFAVASGASFLDSIVEICDRKGIEIETAAKLLTPHVKSMIEKEAMDLNLITKKTLLEFE